MVLLTQVASSVFQSLKQAIIFLIGDNTNIYIYQTLSSFDVKIEMLENYMKKKQQLTYFREWEIVHIFFPRDIYFL